jgi:hypothetical protein
LNNVEKISESLSDLAKVAKNIDLVEIKELTEKIVKDVIKELGEAKTFLDKKSKELFLTLEERLNLNELKNELSKIGSNLAHLKEIEGNLKNLKDIGEGVSGLNKSFSNLDSLDNLGEIKSEIANLTSKVNLDPEKIGKGIGGEIKIDNDEIARKLKEGLGEKLESFNKCSACKEMKPILIKGDNLNPIAQSVDVLTDKVITFRAILEDND